jgi:tetratricopeptide (TPR) repeat protein
VHGRYQEALKATLSAVQSNPGLSVSYGILAASLTKFGHAEKAEAAAKEVLALQPSFGARGFFGALAIPTTLSEPLAQARRQADLPP